MKKTKKLIKILSITNAVILSILILLIVAQIIAPFYSRTIEFKDIYHIITVIVLIAIMVLFIANLSKRKTIEYELMDNLERLKTLINASPDIICFKDKRGRFIEGNDALLEYMGLTDKEYKNKTDLELAAENPFYKDSFLTCAVTDKRAWEQGTNYHEEERILQPDGSVKIFDMIKVPLFHDDGSKKGLVILGRDITERSLMEEALRESEALLLQVTENNMDLIALTDLDGVIKYATPSHEKTLGYSQSEIIGKPATRFLDNACHDKLLSTLDKDIFTHKNTIECKCRNKDGDPVYIETHGKLLYDKEGEPEKYIFCSRDITQRKIAEKRLQESEERYRCLIELSPEAIVVHDRSSIDYVNKSGLNLIGATDPKMIYESPVVNFIHQDYLKAIKQGESEGFRLELGDATISKEFKLIALNKKVIDVEGISSPIIYKGKVKTLTLIRDITERKNAEKLEKRIKEEERLKNEAIEYDKLKTEFFSNLSHEFKTPLNVILGVIQLLELKAAHRSLDIKDSVSHKHINILKQNCYRLLRLVNNLIDITKMDSGYLELNLENHNIVNLVEDITLSVAEYMEQNNIRLEFDTDIEEKKIACDPDKVERIMLNLLSNAIKFTGSNGTIAVSIQDMGEKISIRVKDSGRGIPKERVSEIFDRFRQVDKSFTRNHEGSGIGLSLVKSLVDMHGGSIRVESEENVGSEFIIELPIIILDNCIIETNDFVKEYYVERINIEFSDIYINNI